MDTAKTIIAEALDEFDVEEFADQDFSAMAADTIISALERVGFRIVAASQCPQENDNG